MRKLLMGALAVSATLAIGAVGVGVATADPNDAEATLSVTAKPTNAGTKKKPKNTTVGFDLNVNKPGTTVEVIEVELPSGLKFSGKGLKKCNVDDLIAEGTGACPPGSSVGPKGSATAVVGPALAPLNFDVYPFAESNTSYAFYLSQIGGALQSVVHGKITNSGRKMSITIPLELRQPGGLDASLTGINQTFKGKVKKKYAVSSTKCPKGGWEFGGNLIFATRKDGTPPPPREDREVTVKCQK